MLECEGGGIAGREDPGEAGIEAVGELVGQHKADVVPPVVFGRERLAVVQLLSRAVEEAVGMAPCVAEPAGQPAEVFLCKEFYAVGPSPTHAHLLFPSLRAAPERGAVLVFKQIVHILVVALDGEVEGVHEVVEEASGHLVGVHGLDVRRDGYPEVGGQRDGGGAEEVEILGHVGVAHLGRELVIDEVTPTEAGLETGVEFALYIESGEVEAEVHFEMVVDAPVVFGVGHHFVGAHSALAYSPLFVGSIVFRFHAGRFGGEVVEDVVGAELNGMVGSGCVVEIDTSQNVANAGLEDKGEGVLVVVVSVLVFFGHLEVAAVAGVGSADVHEELGCELVIPAQAAHDVAPVVAQSFMALEVVAVVHPIPGIEVVVAHVVRSI